MGFPLDKPSLRNMYRFTVPPAVELLNFWTLGEAEMFLWIFHKLGFFAGGFDE
jgi:hypothetical protein